MNNLYKLNSIRYNDSEKFERFPQGSPKVGELLPYKWRMKRAGEFLPYKWKTKQVGELLPYKWRTKKETDGVAFATLFLCGDGESRMKTSMLLCGIESSYLSYLRSHCPNVSLDPTQNRKFVGVLFEINGFMYCAPLTSPKPKHANMSDKQPDIYKINGGKLGLINLNNMIPVTQSVIVKIDINKEPKVDYRELMKKQMIHIRKDEELIQKKAAKLYKIVNSGKQPKLNSRCCEYLKLEAAAPLYTQAQVAATLQKKAN